jgi:LysR family hydrogen peroxide-inducible transcriptional activator
MVTLRQLRYFLAVARHGHFGRAAEECNVSQPSLSAQIQALEAMLGVQLIERKRSGIALTEMGKTAERRAHDIVTGALDLVDYTRHQASVLTGPLNLGVIPSIAPYLLPKALAQLQKRFPGLQLKLRETLTDTLVKEVSAGRLDVALISLPIFRPGLERIRLFDEAFVLLAPAAKAAELRTPAQRNLALASGDLLLLEEGHCMRDQALTFCRGLGADSWRQYGASSLSTITQMVANGYGTTLLPEMAVPTEIHPGAPVAVFRLDEPQPRRTVGLVWRKTSARKRDFVELGRVLTEAACETLAEATTLINSAGKSAAEAAMRQ